MERVQPNPDKGGTWIEFGDKAYRVPPLSLRQVKDLRAKIDVMRELQGLPTDEQMDTVIEVVHGALSRNYPAMVRDDVYDMVDLGNFMPVMLATVRVSGLTEQEGGPVGETAASTGTSSTSP